MNKIKHLRREKYYAGKSTLQSFAALIFLLYLSAFYLTFVLSHAILNALLERDEVFSSQLDRPVGQQAAQGRATLFGKNLSHAIEIAGTTNH